MQPQLNVMSGARMGVQNELSNKMLQNNSTGGNYTPVTKIKGKQLQMLWGRNNIKKHILFL